MATSGEVSAKIAELLHQPEHKATYVYRVLRDGGEVTKGPRGRAAVDISVKDTTKLLFGLIAGFLAPKETLSTVRDVSRLEVSHAAAIVHSSELLPNHYGWNEQTETWRFDKLALPKLQALPARHSFEEAVAAIIESAISRDFDHVFSAPDGYPSPETLGHNIDIYFYGPEPRAGIEIRFVGIGPVINYTEEATYQLPEVLDANSENYDEVKSEILSKYGKETFEIRCKITTEVIYEIADLLKA